VGDGKGDDQEGHTSPRSPQKGGGPSFRTGLTVLLGNRRISLDERNLVGKKGSKIATLGGLRVGGERYGEYEEEKREGYRRKKSSCAGGFRTKRANIGCVVLTRKEEVGETLREREREWKTRKKACHGGHYDS